MKTPKYAIAPEGCATYLTPNKKYEIYDYYPIEKIGSSFRIIDDEDDELICVEIEDGHINFKDWTLE